MILNNLLLNKVTAVMVFFSVCLVGPWNSACAQQRMGIPAPKKTVMPNQDVVLPMLRFHRLPMIELTVNGQGPYRMIVDTGAAGVVIQSSIASKMELPAPEGMPRSMRVQTPGGTVPATLHTIEKLKIGGAVFEDVWSIATELPFGDKVDGIIGMNIFKECLMTYDYPGNRLVLSRGELPATNQKDILDFTTPRMPDSHPYIDLTINGETKSTFVDSGFSAWFSVPRDSKEDYQFLSGPVEARMGQSVGPNRTYRDAARVKGSFQVGHYEAKDPIILLGDERMVGTLFLENFAVTFDLKNKRVRLQRDSTEPLTQPALRILGFRLSLSGDDMKVVYIHPKSEASKLGLGVDDVVLEIAGRPAKQFYDSKELFDLVQGESKISIKFRSKEEGSSDELMEFEVLELLK